jgi:hypothetical protein
MLLTHPLGDRNSADKTPQTAVILGGLKYARFQLGINCVKMLKLGFWRNSDSTAAWPNFFFFKAWFKSLALDRTPSY